jgi:hypothetical protein
VPPLEQMAKQGDQQDHRYRDPHAREGYGAAYPMIIRPSISQPDFAALLQAEIDRVSVRP